MTQFESLSALKGEISQKGFGEYDLLERRSHASFIKIQKVRYLVETLFFGLGATLVGSVFFTCLPFSGLGIGIALVGQILALSLLAKGAIVSVLKYRAFGKLAASTSTLPFCGPPVGVWNRAPLSASPLVNAQISNQTKLDLIGKAKESIVFTGSYCGGEVFDTALGLIEDKLKEGSLKEVIILSSDFFITKQNRKTLARLEKSYPEVFQYVLHPESELAVNATGSLVLSHTNHAKALVVDGTLAVIGGTGLTDTWANPKGQKNAPFLPSSYLDTDYLLQSNAKEGMVQTIYHQLRKLHAVSCYKHKDPKIFEKLKKKPFVAPRTSHATLDQFMKIEGSKLLLSFPEQETQPIEEELIRMVEGAKNEVFVSHMYFHPSLKLLKAMEEAVKRGVKFTIITNSYGKKSPSTHFFYAPINKLLLANLVRKEQVYIYENQEDGVTLHFKFFAVDDEVIVGSANLGDRSLKNKDYEMSLLLKSKEFVELGKRQILDQVGDLTDQKTAPSFISKIMAHTVIPLRAFV